MKKIGVLFGRERSFPEALIARINGIAEGGTVAEAVNIDKVMAGKPMDYAVVVDRISGDVPFYRALLKNAAVTGTAVIGNPFLNGTGDYFFTLALAGKLGIPVPATTLLPSYDKPAGTSDASFSNLAFPMDWEAIFAYIGFPAYMKAFDGEGTVEGPDSKKVQWLPDRESFFEQHSRTGQQVMLLQEEIRAEQYYRCFCIGGRYLRTVAYDRRNPLYLRYQTDVQADEALRERIEGYALQLTRYLGYEVNMLEFAVREDIPYLVNGCEPVPAAEPELLGAALFEWLVETTARYTLERAEAQSAERDNLHWGEYLRASAGTGFTEVRDLEVYASVKAEAVSLMSAENAPVMPVRATKTAKPKKATARTRGSV